MSSLDEHQAYRFVVVYRREPREIPGAKSQWRGWVAPVPESSRRLGFNNLEDLPDLIQRWIDNEPAGSQHDQDHS